MSQKSSRNSSRKAISPNEINDWTNLIDSIPMEPLEREIYEEHIKAMKEFHGKKPVDPKSIPSTKHIIEEEECSADEEEEPKLVEANTDEEKDERLKQRDQAKQDFDEDEEFHAAQFRKSRDWETRKRLALENLEQPIELATEVMELLMYGTPIQFVNKVPDPELPEIELTGVLALYLTPECIARDQLFVDNETPLSLSIDVSPMGRNVFEIVSDDEGMTGFPITYKSVVFIKVHYNEDNRDFFLSIDISSPYTVGKLYLQDSIDDLCQFQLLSINKINNKNQELIDINSPVLIKHVKTGFFIMSKVNITVMNICGEEKFVLGSDEIEDNNLLWKLIYGSFNDDLEFDFNSFVTDRWWQPQMSTGNYIPPNTTLKDPFFCSKPSTSRDNYEPGPSNAPFVRQQIHRNEPEPFNSQWIEVQPGLLKTLGPPGSANEWLENPEELFTCIKKKTLGRTKKESQQIVVDYLESVRNHNATPPRSTKALEEPSSWPKSKASDRKIHADKTESTVDFMKKLNPKTKFNNELIRDNKFAKETFVWPKAPEIASPNSKPVLDNPEKIIDAIRKINLQNAEMSPGREQTNNKMSELFIWPTIPDANTSTSTKDIIKQLEAGMIDLVESEEYVPTKLSKDHENEDGDLKPDTFASSDLTVTHLAANELHKIDKKMGTFLRSKIDCVNPLDDTEDEENILLMDGFWDFFDTDNTHLMHDAQDDLGVGSNNSTVEKGEIDLEQEENVQVNASANSRIEEGQGDVCPQENSDKDKNN